MNCLRFAFLRHILPTGRRFLDAWHIPLYAVSPSDDGKNGVCEACMSYPFPCAKLLKEIHRRQDCGCFFHIKEQTPNPPVCKRGFLITQTRLLHNRKKPCQRFYIFPILNAVVSLCRHTDGKATVSAALAATHLESLRAQTHFHKASLVVGSVVGKNLPYACSGIDILRHHIEIASSAGSRQLVAEAKVVDERGEMRHGSRVGAAVEELVLRPCLAYKPSHTFKVHVLYCLEHIERMGFHVAQKHEFVALVEEHLAHDFGKDGLRRACYSRDTPCSRPV